MMTDMKRNYRKICDRHTNHRTTSEKEESGQ